MRIVLTRGDVDDALDQIVTLAGRLRAEHAELRGRYVSDRDGYPTRASGSAPSGSPTNEVDDDGTPIPQHPDPVGRLVASRDDPTDPIGTALACVVLRIQDARRSLEAGVSDAARARPPIKIPDPDELWCESCLRAKVHEPRGEGCGKLCRWCRDWNRQHQSFPAVDLIDLRSRGVRITDQLVASVERRRADQRRAARKTRR